MQAQVGVRMPARGCSHAGESQELWPAARVGGETVLAPWAVQAAAGPSCSPPHVHAAQVGLGVLVLAQVLARQVRERQAVAAACAHSSRRVAVPVAPNVPCKPGSDARPPRFCDGDESRSRPALQNQRATVAAPFCSPPPPDTASAGIAGRSSVAAAAAPRRAPAACLPASSGSSAAHRTLHPLLRARCCLKHCKHGSRRQRWEVQWLAHGQGREQQVPAPARRSVKRPIAQTWLGATTRMLTTACILPKELAETGWFRNSRLQLGCEPQCSLRLWIGAGRQAVAKIRPRRHAGGKMRAHGGGLRVPRMPPHSSSALLIITFA